MFSIIFVILMILNHSNLINGQLINYTKCGKDLPSPTLVKLDNCDNPDMCSVNRKQPIHFGLSYKSPIDAQQLQLNIWISIWGFWIAIRPKAVPVCGTHNIDCPIIKGESYSYNITINAPWFPQVRTKIKFLLSSGKSEPVTCLIMKIKVI
ncbi:mite group 2 allergen Tyr p 2-like [Panonychus citri]|uniref:mite group 2 allergen Tyr p 2-like n=1 Tax=Panonychus citri TaxID=50023 RepID=UPI002307D29B|nr:mite group 2 allergen Tyr p 2-like [Panonychus citri]